MYKKIVVSLALDHGIGSQAMAAARKLLDDGGQIFAIHVVEKIPTFAQQYLEKGQYEKIQAQALEKVHERIGKAKDAEAIVLTGHPGKVVSDYAEKIGADCIVTGSHKPGLKDFFLGSTAARIIRYSPCSVHVLR